MTIELMAPVGSFEALTAAIGGGADSIYFGVDKLHMRAHATSFSLKEMKKVLSICKKKGVKAYLTLNTLIYDEDIELLKTILQEAKKQRVDAVIASDMAVLEEAKKLLIPLHLSTQCNVSNFSALKHYASFADAIVLARELTLLQIRSMKDQIEKEQIKGPSGQLLKLELFVHGALCIAISGKCHMSLTQYNASANRGECYQVCRRKFRVIDEETNQELLIDNRYVMSPKDLCTLPFLDEIINSGISILKIEGRARSADYVFTVVKAYKDALKEIKSQSFTKESIEKKMEELKKVYNRGFWEGYYLGKKPEWSNAQGSLATEKKVFVGKITNYFSKSKIAECKVTADTLNEGDSLYIMGPTTGVLRLKIEKLKNHDSFLATFPTEKVRRNDKVYKIVR